MAEQQNGGGVAAAATGGRRTLPDVTVEVVNDHNHALVWGATQQKLRGRWSNRNLAPGDTSMEAGLMSMPEIPGLLITVSQERKLCLIHDPLADDGNRRLLDRVSSVCEAVFKEKRTFVPDTVREGASNDEMATWVYWMWRAVQSGNARVVSGGLPDRGEHDIRRLFPGCKITKKFFDEAEKAVMAQVREAAMMAAEVGAAEAE